VDGLEIGAGAPIVEPDPSERDGAAGELAVPAPPQAAAAARIATMTMTFFI
jgi:hypothetical protein